MRPLRWWAESAPPSPGGDRVKVSENLGATSVAPVAPVDTSLLTIFLCRDDRQVRAFTLKFIYSEKATKF